MTRVAWRASSSASVKVSVADRRWPLSLVVVVKATMLSAASVSLATVSHSSLWAAVCPPTLTTTFWVSGPQPLMLTVTLS